MSVLSSRLYAILDVDVAIHHGWRPADLARAYFAGGARLLQVRAKAMSGADYLALCEAVVGEGRRAGAQVIVNDRADIARIAGAHGLHVGQDDLPPRASRSVVGDEMLIGLSTHTHGQLEAAAGEPIQYVAIGPVFATGSKDTGYEAVGIEMVRQAVGRAAGRPVVAIGGITLERAASVIEAGASAVAIISDLLAGSDPRSRTTAYLDLLDVP